MTLLVERLMRIKEAANMLRVHPNTLRNWEKRGLIKAIRMGSRRDRRYKYSDLIKLIEIV